jgi:hypothetical protein
MHLLTSALAPVPHTPGILMGHPLQPFVSSTHLGGCIYDGLGGLCASATALTNTRAHIVYTQLPTHTHTRTAPSAAPPCPSSLASADAQARPLSPTSVYSTPLRCHLAVNLAGDRTGLRPLSQDRGTPELRRMSPGSWPSPA